MVAYTNAAANEFCWELYKILGPNAIRNLCLRTGNLSGVEQSFTSGSFQYPIRCY